MSDPIWWIVTGLVLVWAGWGWYEALEYKERARVADTPDEDPRGASDE